MHVFANRLYVQKHRDFCRKKSSSSSSTWKFCLRKKNQFIPIPTSFRKKIKLKSRKYKQTELSLVRTKRISMWLINQMIEDQIFMFPIGTVVYYENTKFYVYLVTNGCPDKELIFSFKIFTSLVKLSILFFSSSISEELSTQFLLTSTCNQLLDGHNFKIKSLRIGLSHSFIKRKIIHNKSKHIQANIIVLKMIYHLKLDISIHQNSIHFNYLNVYVFFEQIILIKVKQN